MIIANNLSRRSPLLVSRLLGAEHARGDVLVFLDSHVEPTPVCLPQIG